MSEKIPAVGGSQLRRALKRDGWEEVRQRGSHVRLEKEDKSLTIPDHGGRIIPRGTLGAVLKAAGLTPDDLRVLMQPRLAMRLG
jgi:predicted RNA binding protein YcfA (HicA-like mRNA interferase family)